MPDVDDVTDIFELRRCVHAGLSLANTIGAAALEIERGLIAAMKRSGMSDGEISAELSAILAKRHDDPNVELILGNTIAQLKAELNDGAVVLPAGHA